MKPHFSFTLIIALLTSTTFFSGCASKKVQKPYKTKFTSKARHKSTMRCYTVRGKRYSPTYVKVGQVMKGVSSWYGPNFHGKYTSNGEVYNMHARTAAHKTWPMDTMVKVTNLQNGKTTTVRINDRGPFVRGRIIDCSYKAGKEIGLDRMGIAKVSIEVVGFAGKVESKAKISQAKKSKTESRVKLSNFGIQIGAFKLREGAEMTREKFAKRYPKYQPVVRKFSDVDGSGEVMYRVWLMGFSSEEEARDFKACNALSGAVIVRN